MCETAQVNGVIVETVGELSRAIGTTPITQETYRTFSATNCCLCQIDIPATCQKVKATYDFDAARIPEWIIRVPEEKR
jgi:hypothetical protein